MERQALVTLANQRGPRGRSWAAEYRDDPDFELRDRSALEPTTALFPEMLASSFSNERRLAVRDLLAREQVAELESLLDGWETREGEMAGPTVRAATLTTCDPY